MSFQFNLPPFSLKSSTLLGLALLAQTGCQSWVASEKERPQVPVIGQFEGSVAAVDGDVGDGWLEDLGSLELKALVGEALEANPTLGASLAGLEVTLASAQIAGARLFPNISADLSGRRNRSNTSGGDSIYSSNASGTLGVSWELDLWGRLTQTRNAAREDFAAAEAEYAGARFSLVGTVARFWVQLIEAKAQLDLAVTTLKAFEENLEVIGGRFERGLSNALDLQLIRASTESARSVVFQREEVLAAARRNLELALGRYPSGLIEVEEDFPSLAAAIPVGLPSSVLERRPDVMAATSRVNAQAFRTVVANKNRLPALTLTGSFGRSSSELKNLSDPDFSIWSIFGGLSAPLFNFGRLEAEQERAEAQYRQVAMNYINVALRAFNEVEGLLTAEGLLRERERATAAVLDASEEAERISWERYRSGLVDIVTVLDSQRRADGARRDVLTLKSQRVQNRINLHLALGGSFEAEPDSQSTSAMEDEMAVEIVE